MANVVKRARDNNGNPIGKRHANPLLDTREYECELLEDWSFMRYHANVIAEENFFAQCDDVMLYLLRLWTTRLTGKR